MKKFYLVLYFSIISFSILAQSEEISLTTILPVLDACISIRDAVSSNDTAYMKQSAMMLRECNVGYFFNLDCMDTIPVSFNGHLIFDEDFVDKLSNGENAYENADEFVNENKKSKKDRGQTADGSIRAKTCFVKAGESSKYKFTSKGHQELAVIAEAGGLLTMKIRVTNRDGLDKRFDDKKNVKTGLPHRQIAFELPENRLNYVEVEIINCGNKDCSFVMINN